MVPRTVKRAGFAIAFLLAGVSTAAAFGAGGGVGAGGIGGMGGINAGSISVGGAGIPGFNGGVAGLGPVFRMPQRFRDLNVTGQVGVEKTSLPLNATIIRLSLDGREIPMRLDTEQQSADLQFNPDEGYGKDLYRSILTKRVEVVGRAELREQIAQAAEQSKPLKIEGYVFDRTSPYFVVKSVQAQ